MRTYLVAFVLSLLTGLVLTRVLRDLAHRYGLYDSGGGRKIHKQPIPRLGGVAVVLSMCLPLVGLGFWQNDISRALWMDQPLLLSLLGGGGLLFLVGLVDDLRDMRAILKLFAQVAAGLIVYSAGLRIEAISVPFFSPVQLGMWSLPATIFWMVLVTNAVNLIDGMDGLAGGVVVLAGGTLFIMSVIEDNVLAAVLLACVVGATMGFLAYNVNPATIFLGDAGSLTLGFLLALTAVHSSQKSYTLFSIVAAMMALGLPIFDLGLAVVRRFLSGQPIFRADQHHVHHRLLRMGLSQSQSVIVLFAGAIVLEGLALVFIYADDRLSALAIAALLPMIVIVVRLLGYDRLIMSARRARVLQDIEQAAAVGTEALLQVRRNSHHDFAELWSKVGAIGSDLGLEHIRLELTDARVRALVGDQRHWAWSRTGQNGADTAVHLQALWTTEANLTVGDRRLGRIEVQGHDERQLMAPLSKAWVQILSDTLASWLVARLLNPPMDSPLPSPAESSGSTARQSN